MDLRYGENGTSPRLRHARHGIAGAISCTEGTRTTTCRSGRCWQLVNEFTSPAAAIIKHTNPAGCSDRKR